jgi:hypothetical protein
MPPQRRGTLTIAFLSLATAAALMLPSTAFGETINNYFGYANLTASNPPAGTCPGSIAGIACSGNANWDYSQTTWNSGEAYFDLGFICSSNGILVGHSEGGNFDYGKYTVLWSDYCPGHYNRTAIAHLSGATSTYNYLQARGLIFP